MKKSILFISVLMFAGSLYGQITKVQTGGLKPSGVTTSQGSLAPAIPYDSLRNFLGTDVMQYKGQTLYLKEDPQAEAARGYQDLAVNPNFDLGASGRNVYKSVKIPSTFDFVSDYKHLKDRYYIVTDVIANPQTARTMGAISHFLQLEDTEAKLKFYAAYETSTPKMFEKFLVVGYFEKQRKTYIGKTFLYTGKEPVANRKEYYKGIQDMEGGGKRNDVAVGSVWTCVDVSLEVGNNHELIAIMENPEMGKGYVLITDLTNPTATNAKFTTAAKLDADMKEAEAAELSRIQSTEERRQKAIEKYGPVEGALIANGQVKVGMSREKCKAAMGEPHDITTLFQNGKETEQWFYKSGHYLLFQNGVLFKQTYKAPIKSVDQIQI